MKFSTFIAILFTHVSLISSRTVHKASDREARRRALAEYSGPLQKRDDYSDALQKGKDLWAALVQHCGADVNSPSLATLTAPTTQNGGLGWTVLPFSDGPEAPIDGVETMFGTLGISTGNQYYSRYASSPFRTVGDQSVRTEYANSYGPKSGVIVAEDNKRAGGYIAWSLVTAMIWADTCSQAGSSASGLQYVFRDNIVNTDTKSFIDKVGMGKTFLPNSDGFNALLGSANGKGVAYLLLQHSNLVGKKTIKQVTTFKADDGAYEMYFQIIPWTAPEGEPGTSAPARLRRWAD